jgi:hypothetical protein
VIGRAGRRDPVRLGGRRDAGGRGGRPGSEGRVAAAALRRRVQGAPALRLGAHRHRGPGALPADPPLPRPCEKGQLEQAFFRCWSPRPVTLPELVAVAGARWGIEDCFAEARGEAGLDHYQVRKYGACTGTPPCPCSRTRSSPSPPAPPASGGDRAAPLKRGSDACGQRFAPPRTYAPPAFVTDETGGGLIPLAAAGARRLFNLRTRVTRPAEFHGQWPAWRRRRQQIPLRPKTQMRGTDLLEQRELAFSG